METAAFLSFVNYGHFHQFWDSLLKYLGILLHVFQSFCLKVSQLIFFVFCCFFFYNLAGILGVSCLLLSVRLAHSSLMSKLEARDPLLRSHEHASDDEDEIKTRNRTSTDSLSELVRITSFFAQHTFLGLYFMIS